MTYLPAGGYDIQSGWIFIDKINLNEPLNGDHQYPHFTAKIMAADDMATKVSRAPATMQLT